MLIEEDFIVNITNKNIKFYEEMGFKINLKDKITVKSSQLTPYNKNVVKVKCDYCGEIINRAFRDHYKIVNKEMFNGKHACKKCSKFKNKEIIKEFLDGVHPSQSEKAIKKRISTNKERYGGNNPFHSTEVKDKAKDTLLKNHGVDNFFKHESFYDIRNKTMIDKYGYAFPMLDPSRKDDIVEKIVKTLSDNNNAPCSTQQKYINDIIGGEINYPISKLLLDIAFTEEKIYVEYQGSGHNLNVKLSKINQDNFDKKEKERYYYMKNKNWKMIEIISQKDNLPKKDKLLEMMILAREILKNTSYIQFDIDNSTVRYYKETKNYDFGETISYYDLHKNIKHNNYDYLIS